MVENINEYMPANTESDSKVSNTFIDTLPHKIVDNKKLESSRIDSMVFALLRPCLASTSSCNLLRLKKAKFNPEKIADCVTQSAMAIQIKIS